MDETEIPQPEPAEEVKPFRARKFQVSTLAGMLVMVIALAASIIAVQQKTQPKGKATGIPLTTVKANTGLSEIIYGLPQYPDIYKETDLTVTNAISGVYEIKRTVSVFPCTIGSKHPDGSDCEPDRYEVRFSSVIPHIFGLGFVTGANQVELSDFLDANFSFSHCVTPRDHYPSPTPPPIDFWVTDPCRMRTPVMVFPQQGMIIAYVQPYVKILRLSRNGQYGCPVGDTCIIMKKRMDYNDGVPAPLVIIKKSNIADAYTAYRDYLVSKGFFYKEPHYKAYGVNWETWGELDFTTISQASISGIVNSHYNGVTDPNKQIILSSVTMGGGYWGNPVWNGKTCDTSCPFNGGMSCGGCPATDALVQNLTKFPGGFNNYFSWLTDRGIYPLIGMRQRIQSGGYTPNWSSSAPVPPNALPTAAVPYYTTPPPYPTPTTTLVFDNKSRITNLLRNNGATGDLFWKTASTPVADAFFHHIESKGQVNGQNTWDYLTGFYMLNTYNTQAMNVWIDTLKSSYGNFKGIKNDDMLGSDQKYVQGQFFGQLQGSNATDPPDNIASVMFPLYDSKFNKDILIFSRDDWMSAGTDGQVLSWPGQSRWNTTIEYADWANKLYFDSALTQVTSGYPNPIFEGIYSGQTDTELMRNFQLNAFFPISVQAYGFWHINNVDKQNTAISYSKLRNRLHQYAFDQAMKWYDSGVPTLMRPLYIDYPNDANVYNLYSYAGAHPEPNRPTDEFMFGNALLIRPIFADYSSYKTYLPSLPSSGKWVALIHTVAQGNVYDSGQTINYSILSTDDYPIFVKQGELLIIGGYPDASVQGAYVYLGGLQQSSEYIYSRNDGKHRVSTIKLQAKVVGGEIRLYNLSNNTYVVMGDDPYQKGFKYVADVSRVLTEGVPSPSVLPTTTPISWPNPACTSWTNFYIQGTGGACTPFDPNYKYNYASCNTANGQTVTIKMTTVQNATQMQLTNADTATDCTAVTTWPSPSPFVTQKTGWSLTAGTGDRKVCGRFTNPGGGAAICGGVIHVVQ